MRALLRCVGMLALLCVGTTMLMASPLLVNGDFGDGLNGWTTSNSGLQSDTTVVFELISPGGPTDPIAVSGASLGPASRVLYQDFLVPANGVTDASFTFDFFSANSDPLDSQSVDNIQGGDFDGPNLFRIDLVDPGQPVFTTAALFTLFADPGGIQGSDTALTTIVFGDPAALTAFLNTYAGLNLRLRIGHAESTFPWSTGVDNFELSASEANPIPEPTSLSLFALGALALCIVYRRPRVSTARL